MILDRSLEYRGYTGLNDVSSLITLERLADGAYLENNRQMYLDRWVSSIPRLFRVICSMTNLEKLHFFNCNLTDTVLKDLACVFQSCPKLTELHLILFRSLKLEMNGDLKKDLRPGFQRLRVFELHFGIDSWLVMQEIFT
jgi:hypothetical protein